MALKSIIPFMLIVSSLCFTFAPQTQNIKIANEELKAIPWPFTLCGGDADWTIQTLTMDQTPKRNIYDDIDVTGTAKNPITFKRAEIYVKLNGVFLDKEVIEFTNSYDGGDSIQFTYKNYVPSFAPVGSYFLTFTFFDSNENKNGCLQFQFKL